MGKRKKNFGKKLPVDEEQTQESTLEEQESEVMEEELDAQMTVDDEEEPREEEPQDDLGEHEECDETTEYEETKVCEEEPEQDKPGEENEEETNKNQTQTIDYLDMARRVQADFDNYRRHAQEEIKKSRLDGQASVIEVFLPCLDTFKEAKKNIQDENILKGFEMVENKINEALTNLGVEKMQSIGQKYDPHLHNVIAVMRNDEYENDIILDEYQAGYKLNDKVLRYAKVIVNKKED